MWVILFCDGLKSLLLLILVLCVSVLFVDFVDFFVVILFIYSTVM